MPKLHNTHPVTSIQPRPCIRTQNLAAWSRFRDASPADLLHTEATAFGQSVYFTTPLQRRAEGVDCGAKFWWEPSGGLNEGLFAGIITGVRTLSTGYNDEDRSYIPEATFPVYLITFSPYRNPVYVLPWHVWQHEAHYEIDHESAKISYINRKNAKV